MSNEFDPCNYIANTIIPSVYNVDRRKLDLAWSTRDVKSCDARAYSNTGAPDWARFWSNETKSPNENFWWMFEYDYDKSSWVCKIKDDDP